MARYLHEAHSDTFQRVLSIMVKRVPGVASVESRLMDDGFLTLRFQDGSFKTPFLDRYVSDGTIKMVAQLVLLHDPRPHPLLCVEEPENQLYPKLMGALADEFHSHAHKGEQVLVSNHSPDFLNAIELDEACWLAKHQANKKFRNPDHLGSPSRELKSLTGNRCEKRAGSRLIGQHLDLDNARSPSFQHFVVGSRHWVADVLNAWLAGPARGSGLFPALA